MLCTGVARRTNETRRSRPRSAGRSSLSQTHVKHHYVPQFYLRQWAGEDRTFYWYGLAQGNRMIGGRVGPKGAAFARDLYGAPPAVHWEAHDPNIIETQVMSSIDNDAALVLQKVVGGTHQLDDKERTAWATFLNSLIHRHRDDVFARDARAPRVVAEVSASLLARYRADDGSREKVARVLDDVDLTQAAKTAHRTVMVQKIRDPDAIAAIKALAWTVVAIDPKVPLITTDRPLLVNLGRGGPPQLMTLPLSPTRMFVAYVPDPSSTGEDVQSLLANVSFASDLLLLNEHPCCFVYSSREIDDSCIIGDKVIRLRSAAQQALARWASVTDDDQR